MFSADLDGDSDNGLATANPNSDNISILFNLSSTPGEYVDVDIRPGSCPNPLNPKANFGRGKSVLPVAILGTEGFSVRDVDPSTVTLLGVSPLRWSYEDVATPADRSDDDCACTEDGYEDLTLKFNGAAIFATLAELPLEDEMIVTITAELNNGGLVEGSECIKLLTTVEKLPLEKGKVCRKVSSPFLSGC